MDSGFYVYRFLNKDGKILYVGRTHNLKKRFLQHSHLTDQVEKIEYIICDTEIEMIIKELYYINFFNNELSTNVKDVYDKPKDFGFKDIWNIYLYNKPKKRIPYEDDYEKIYVIKISFCDVYDFGSTYYYTGKRNKDGEPEMSKNPLEAKRYSNIKNTKKLIKKFNDFYEDLNEKIFIDNINGIHEFQPCPTNVDLGIYMEDEILTFLFHLYNDKNRTRDKKLYFEDVALNWKQNGILAEYTVFKTMTKYQFNKQWDLLEKERFKLRKDPDWKEPIWHEEFVRYYIKNNRDLNKSLEEYEKDSKNKQIPFRKLYFLPNGYRKPGAPINYFTDEF